LVNVLLASPLADELVERIAAVDPRVHLLWRPDLLGTPRYPGDHYPPIHRTDAQSAEWRRLLGQAEVMLDVDQPSAPDIVRMAPRLKWVQSSSSGVGDWIRRLDLVEASILVTNAAGMHARPLAEYVVFVMLYFARRWPEIAAEQRARHWQRRAVDTLEGKTLGVVGLGNVGRMVAKLARPFGMRVVGTRRSGADADVDQVFTPDRLDTVLARATTSYSAFPPRVKQPA
jgi:glyoxylate/hydroxypyruvate reductase A